MTGKMLIALTSGGFSLARAWAIVRPTSSSTGEAAKQQAYRYIRHHLQKYPLGINEALEASGISIKDMTDMCAEAKDATKWVWDEKLKRHVPSEIPDWNTRFKAFGATLRLVSIDEKARQELAVGKAEMKKMHLNTGMKFKTIQEWEEHMKGRDAEVLASRALAAKEMKLIAAGRQIIQEEGQEAADKMKQAALDAGLTGDEHIPGIDEPDDDEVKPPPAGR